MMYCVLTYNHKHRKTYDLLLTLKAFGYNDICVVATPWVERKNFIPMIPHRPNKTLNLQLSELCNNLNYKLIKSSYDDLENTLINLNPKYTLIAGAGILSKNITDKFTIINSHPAFLPYVRGLDALKWAIYENNPIGVTTYVISEETDTGLLIKREKIDLYKWDTFHSIAYRQYEKEIEMLVESIKDLNNIKELKPMEESYRYKIHRRMSHNKEQSMLEKLKERLI